MATATSRLPSGPTNGDSARHQQGAINNGITRAPSTRRRGSVSGSRPVMDSQDGPSYPPPAPEAPRAPPVSSRDSTSTVYRYREDRSFSARAKDLPTERGFALSGDGSEDDFDHYGTPRNASFPEPRREMPKRSYTTASYKSSSSKSIPQTSSIQQQYQRRASETVSTLDSSSQASPISRSSTIRSAKEQRHNWAPDRSPLQQLEVALQGISKEEKRARVQEAEMRLKEQIARRESARGRGSGQDNSPTPLPKSDSRRGSKAEPASVEAAKAAQSWSSRQRDMPQRSATMDTRRQESRRVSAGGRGEYQESQDAARATATTSKPLPGNVQNAAVQPAKEPQFASAGNYNQESARNGRRDAERSQQDYYQPRAQSVHRPSNRRPLPEPRSSNKAPISDSSFPEPVEAATVGKANGKRLQKSPPRAYEYERRAEYGDLRSIPREQYEQGGGYGYGATGAVSQSQEQEIRPGPNAAEANPAPIGLGVTQDQQDSGLPSMNRNVQVNKAPQSKPKKQTVSFNMPPPTPPPLSEWKRAPVAKLRVEDLDFGDFDVDKGRAWWGGGGTKNRRESRALPSDYQQKQVPKIKSNTGFQPPLYLKCGPLLRYTGLRREKIDGPSGPVEVETWRGSVMIVTQDSKSSYETPPTLRLFSQPMDLLPPPPAQVSGEEGAQLAPEYVDPTAGLIKVGRDGRPLYVKPVEHLEQGVDYSSIENDDGLFEQSPSPIDYSADGPGQPVPTNRIHPTDGETAGKYKEIKGIRLYADEARDVTFWRFNVEVELSDKQERIAYRINNGPAIGFWVPARGQSMNIMFHTCNGFSLSVDPNKFSGPDPLWRDVLTEHQFRPFHVMIGGGDQIYNDKVILESKSFQEWTRIKSPHEKHHTPFHPELRAELESFYLERYCTWFSQGLFSLANSQIPMINIWDDHDIIDGYGSYPDHFMRTPVFSGLGNIAFKYYLLFQHQSVPEETEADEPSWLLGAAPGPYIKQRSRSLFMFLGKSIAFLGLDCRTERMREEVLSEQTYDLIWDRCHREIVKGETKHLIVLLGVPIAYPRLAWLENILTSRVLDPVKALGRAGMFNTRLLNKFDGSVEIVDDLDDHWTAKHHKLERTWLIEDLQDLAAEKSVRVTILSGDVHLAAIGQFYSNPSLNLAKDKDYRYMPNIISSAIVNTPSPEMLSDMLNKRNKLHHFDSNTDEDMIPIFTHDVDGKPRNNKRLLPRRNWCSIREYQPGSTPPGTPEESEASPTSENGPGKLKGTLSLTKGDKPPGGLLRRLSLRGPPPTRDFNLGGPARRPVSLDGSRRPSETGESHSPAQAAPRPGAFQRRPTNLSQKAAKKGAKEGEDGAGAYVNLEGGLDITLNLEVSPQDPAGITTPYKLLVPALWYEGGYDPNPEPARKGWKKWFSRRMKKKNGYPEEKYYDYEDGEDEENQGSDGGPPSPQTQTQGQAQAGGDVGQGDGSDGDGEDGGEASGSRPKKRWFGRG